MSTLQGRIALVTGATSGIGYETALGLARAGLRVGLVGRAQGRARASAEAIRQAVPGAEIDVFVADLSAQSEIRRLAGAVREAYPRLDVLVNNAGAIFDRRETTVDGIERTWALDHLGYVLLTLDLLDLLKATAREAGEARIVNVASAAHARGRIDVDDLEGRRAYGAIKA
ncbi:SDR family NAD(P)-dependent oxidoreductase, partial [Methylobacterium segetis]